MALSEHEQRMLEQLEQQFKEDDPKFAEAMEAEPVLAVSASRIIIGVLAAVAGLVLLLLGASLPGVTANVLAGILGFAMMTAGVYVATTRMARTGNKNRVPASTDTPRTGDDKTSGKDRRFFKVGFGDVALWSLFWWV
jgi:hypothetical protein